MIEMKLINILRRLTISVLVLLIVIIIETAYYGLHLKNNYNMTDTAYSVSAPFFTNFSNICSPANLIFLFVIFILSFMAVSNMISKKSNQKEAQVKQVRKEN
jgi:preprotein translocase subunit SecG